MIEKLTNSIGSNRVSMIVYSPSGNGKTSLAKTIDGVYVLSLESGLAPLQDAKIPFVDLTKNDKGELLSNGSRIERIEETFKWLMRPEQMKRYRVIFIDSLSEIGELFFDVIEKRYKDVAENSNKGYDPRQTYGELYPTVTRFVKTFRDMPHYDVVFSCLDSEGDNEETGTSWTTIALPGGKLKKNIPGLVDHVFYLDKKVDKENKDHRKILTSSTAKIFAKNRVPTSVQLEKYEEPDLGKLINKLKGAK